MASIASVEMAFDRDLCSSLSCSSDKSLDMGGGGAVSDGQQVGEAWSDDYQRKMLKIAPTCQIDEFMVLGISSSQTPPV